MYITNGKLVDYLLSNYADIDKLLDLLFKSKILLKKYGRKLKSDEFLQAINEIDAELASVIVLLKQASKLTLHNIDIIINILKTKSGGYSFDFKVKTSSLEVLDTVEGFLNSRFNKVKITKEDLKDDMGVVITGEGFVYKRTIGNDLDKLLNF